MEKIELRKLQGQDVFPMVKIISKIGIKEFKECFDTKKVKAIIGTDKDKKDDAALKTLGMSIALDISGVVLGNIPSCEDEIYLFLSKLSGLSKTDIAELPMADFAEMLIEVFKKEEFKDFFKVVSGLLK